MSREIFLAAARVHTGRAVLNFLGRFWSIHYNGKAPVNSGAEPEADIALAWLTLAEQVPKPFPMAAMLGPSLEEENKSLRTQLRKAKELAIDAIECVEASTYKGDGLVAGLKYRLEDLK